MSADERMHLYLRERFCNEALKILEQELTIGMEVFHQYG